MGRFENSKPTKISLDQANALVKPAVPISKDEYEHVSKFLLTKINDQFIMTVEGNGVCKAIFGKSQLYDPSRIHILQFNLNGNVDQQLGQPSRAGWAAPLTNGEIKSCAQLLNKLGALSQVTASPDRVQFNLIAKQLPQGTSSQDPVMCCVHIVFGPKGFEDANYATVTPINRNDPVARNIMNDWPKYTQAAAKGDASKH
jgi:hypothetical protein